MYGELHIKPWELIRYTFREVLLSVQGLRDKDLLNQLLLRRATFIIASSFGGKNVASALPKLWPVEGQSQKDWLKKAKALLKKADEYTDNETVKKLLNGRSTVKGNG